MLVSKDRFFLDLRKFCFADPKGKLQTDKAFFGCLDHMECEDILHDRKKLDLNVLHTFQDGRATETNIDDLCAVRPALMMRSVQQHGAEAAQVLRPQSMIVACGSRRDRTYFTRGAQVGCIPKLLKEIYGCDELS